MSKKSFYCWYLGFTEAYGLQGQTRIHEVIDHFLNKQLKQKDAVAPSKVTMRLNENSITLIDSSMPVKRNSRKSRKEQTPKSYVIGYDKITYVGRTGKNSDILTCIVRSDTIIEIGSNASKKSLFYLHVFRCDSEESAKKMELYINYFRRIFFKKIEKLQQKQKETSLFENNSKKKAVTLAPTQNEHLINSNLKENFIKRQINKISGNGITEKRIAENSSAGTQSSSSHNDLSFISPVNSNSSLNQYHHRDPKYNSNRPTSPNVKNINDEILGKIQKGEPLLFPPKDYTQTLIKRGNLPDAQYRRSRNPLIIGREGIRMREINQMNLELNDSFQSQSEQVSPRNQSLDDVNRADFNLLDEQLVLNMLDEVVDGMSMGPEYKYEPSKNTKQFRSSKNEDFYEPDEYELFDPNESFTKNPLQMIEEENMLNRNQSESEYFIKRNMSNIKDVARKNNRFKSNENIKTTSAEAPNRKKFFNFSSSKSDKDSNPSENNSLSAASVGVRTNVLTKLGNFKPKIIVNSNALPDQQPNNQERFNNDLNRFSNLNYSNIYSPYRKESTPAIGLRRITEEANELHASSKMFNAINKNPEFILKPTDYTSQNHQNYKNYIQVHDSNRLMNNSSNLLGTLINVNPASNVSKKNSKNVRNYQNNPATSNVINVYELNRRYDYGEANRYDLNDIYY